MAPAGTGSGTIMPFSHHPGWTSSPTRRCRASQSCSSTPPGLDRSIALATEDYLRLAAPRIAPITTTP